MAAESFFQCPECSFALAVRPGGRPYLIGPDGRRRHFFDPALLDAIIAFLWGDSLTATERSELTVTKGVESEYLCRSCDRRCHRDARVDRLCCHHCGSDDLLDLLELPNLPCPSCAGGRMRQMPRFSPPVESWRPVALPLLAKQEGLQPPVPAEASLKPAGLGDRPSR